jgi:hypothetical protein
LKNPHAPRTVRPVLRRTTAEDVAIVYGLCAM